MTSINNEQFPKKEEIFSWIQDLTRWGHRKTGTPEGRKSADYIKSKFEELGMERVKIETVPSLCMIPEEYKLEIDGQALETFYVNYTNHREECGRFSFGSPDERQEFIYAGDGLEEDFRNLDAAGKVVVCSIRFLDSSFAGIAGWFEKADVYDPRGALQRAAPRPDIYSPNNWPGNYFRAMQQGAAGFVGILEDYMDDPCWYCEDYTELGNPFGITSMKLPALWVSRSCGAKLKEKFEKRAALTGCMQVTTLYEYRDALNVSGVLPGASEDMILIHSHHDAVFNGAVQDASGVAEVLALGTYFSRLAKEERKKTLMFAAADTHYTDYRGHQGFIRARQEAGDRILLDVAIEHIGEEARLDGQGNMSLTGEPESRLVYITDETGLYDFVRDAFERYGLEKTVFASVPIGKGPEAEYEFRQDEVISDAYYFSESGIPVVSTVAGPVYLFHPSDQTDKIPLRQLEPVGKAFAEIVLKAADVL